MALDVFEYFQDAVRGGGLAFPVLGIEGQHIEVRAFHRGADLALDEGLDEQGQEVEQEKGLDPALVLEEGRSHRIHGLELLVPLLEVGLVLVFEEHLFGWKVVAVGDQRVHPVAAGVVSDGSGLWLPGHRKPAAFNFHVACVGSWVPPAFLPEPGVIGFGHLRLSPARDAALGQDAGDSLLDGRPVPDTAMGALELGLEFLDPVEGLLERSEARLFMLVRQRLAPDPDDPIALGGTIGGGDHAPKVVGSVGAVRAGAPDDLLPWQVVVLDVAPEPGVLLAAAGEDGDEPSFAVGDVVHVRPGAEFAIRYVHEVGAPRQPAEGFPGLDVGGVVVGVSIA